MSTMQVPLPTAFELSAVLRFISDLPSIEDADEFHIRCDDVKMATPFGMLLIGASLRRWREVDRKRGGQKQFRLIGVSTDDYMNYMGFWTSISDKENSTERKVRKSHVPISRMRVADVLAESRRRSMPPSNIMSNLSAELAELLLQEGESTLNETIAYSIQELLRNAVDHSESESLWYCAQFWPSKDIVELAILDEGRGILNSLLENETLAPKSESEAIQLSLKQGVSRINFDKIKDSENSGVGLFVLCELAKQSGSLFVLSNGTGILLEDGGSTEYLTTSKGVAVRLRIRPSAVGDSLFKTLQYVRSGVKPDRMTPSMFARMQRIGL